MLFDNFIFKNSPELLISDKFNWFDQNPSKNLCGIYAIVSLCNERFYIGSSKNMQKRFNKGHIKDLRNGCHGNTHLQNCHDKYGMDSIFYYLVEECEEKDLLEREQLYIDALWGNHNFMNQQRYSHKPIRPKETYRPLTQEEKDERAVKKRKGEPLKVRDPDGNIHTILGSVKSFASKHGLIPTSFNDLFCGRANEYRGWTLPDTILKKKNYKVISPDGELFEFSNTSEFSKEHDLNVESLRMLVSGWINNHKNWTFPGKERQQFSLKDPQGEIHYFYEIHKFAQEKSIDTGMVGKVLKGKIISVKNWTLPDTEIYPRYELISPDGELVKFNSVKEFSEEYNKGLKYASFLALLSGKIKKVEGWTKPNPENGSNNKIGIPQIEEIYIIFISPEGEEFKVKEAQPFCQLINIPYFHYHAMKQGKMKSSNGWSLKK